MKKLLTSVLAFVFVASLSISAFAETNNGTKSTPSEVNDVYENSAVLTNDKTEAEITVNGEFVSAPAIDTVILVDIIWDDLTFTYKDGDKTWDIENHVDVVGEGAWEATQKPITVVNHSNVGISAAFDFTPAVDGINGTFSKEEITLKTALNTSLEDAPEGSVDFGISGGKISGDGDAETEIGTITVTVKEGSVTGDSSKDELNSKESDAYSSDLSKNGNVNVCTAADGDSVSTAEAKQ